MTCDVCGKDIPRGARYVGERFKNQHFCSGECYRRFLEIKLRPKDLVNFKPDYGTQRRKFTDYLQEWTDDKINWPQAMKQAKDIMEEYDLDWKDMYLVAKYARIYEQVQWDFEWGLYQIFPKYIQPCAEFQEAIKKSKTEPMPLEETYTVKRKKPYIGRVEF